jgi:hypothetical protein
VDCHTSAAGRLAAIQSRVCAMPCVCEAMVRTSLSSVPGRTSTSNRTATTASRTITSGGSGSSPSSTAGTAPSTEFSIGTQPASTWPARTAASTAGLPTHGTNSAPDASGSDRSACSVNVPRGPRNATRRTTSRP